MSSSDSGDVAEVDYATIDPMDCQVFRESPQRNHCSNGSQPERNPGRSRTELLEKFEQFDIQCWTW